MTRRRFTLTEWVVVAATVLLAVGSLLTWYTLPSNVVLDAGVHRTFTAWSGGFAPTTLLPLVFGLTICIPAVLARLADLHVPERIGGLHCADLRVVLAAGAALLLVCELVTRRAYGPVTLERGLGLWMSMVGGAALLGGVLLDRLRASAAPSDEPAPDPSS